MEEWMLEQGNGTNNAMGAEPYEVMSTISIKECAGDDLFLWGLIEGIPCLCPIGKSVDLVVMFFY
jgi:hypothetical protein